MSRCEPCRPEPMALDDAWECVLAEDAVAVDAVPPFANSAMDGYAVRSLDVAEASDATPVRLRVAGTVAAGAPPAASVEAGTAVRIMTGAPIPRGADAVVVVERSRQAGDDEVDLTDAPPPGRHIRPAGDDVPAGAVAVVAGTVLGPGHLGTLASVGVRRPVVHRRPRVLVVSTGDELVDDDRPLGPGQIRESNRPALLAALRTYGVEPVDGGTVPDDRDALIEAFTDGARRHDAVVSSGGVSMGDYDLVKVVLADIADMEWMQVAIRPAKPFAFGLLDGTPVFGLPGNPVSSLVSLSMLAVPGLRRIAGRTDLDLPRVTAVAGPGLTRRPDGRTALVRVRCRFAADGRIHAHPVRQQGSHQMAASADADGLAVLPDGDGAAEGEPVPVVLMARTLRG